MFYRGFTNKHLLTAYCEKYDLQFRFFIKDGVGRDIYYKKGVYSEDHITQFLLQEIGIKDEDFILDIGANIGWHSLTLSHQRQPTIFAFEPDPFNFSLLRENQVLNEKPNVQLFNIAVSNESGTKTLYLYKNHNLGRHSLIRQHNSVTSTQVKTVNLDDFLAEQQMQDRPIKLIKIDIEGFEYMALQGATRALQHCQYLITEFTPYMMQQIGQDPMDFIELIKKAGFTIYKIDPTGLSTPDIAASIRNKEQLDLFCRKEP